MKIRLIIWCTGCLAISVLLFSELWAKLPQWFSLEGLQRQGVFHWGVLGLCILWLWLKRKDILPGMQARKFSLPFIIAGAALIALSIFLPRSDDFLLFLMLMGWLGLFALLFAGASITPSILLAIYGFSLIFPLLMNRWSGEPSSMLVANTVTGITRVFGLPITSEGVVIHLTTRGGDVMSTAIVPGCAGYATIGVFIALFALMMLDIRLPLKKAWYIFLIGLAGTWLQNIIRVVASIAAGYYWGSGALETMHYNAAYVIFPLWYALFAYIYLRQAGWSRVSVKVKKE
ncbi:archaeosortase/exosortase family protein [Chloroflexota bacterium]